MFTSCVNKVRRKDSKCKRIRYKECCNTFRVEVDSEVLEDVHVRGVSDGAHARSEALRVDVSDRLRPHVQHQSVDERDVVADPWLIRYLQHRARLSIDERDVVADPWLIRYLQHRARLSIDERDVVADPWLIRYLQRRARLSIDERDVVADPWLIRYLQRRARFRFDSCTKLCAMFVSGR